MELRSHHTTLRRLFEEDVADRRAVAEGRMTGAELGVRDLARRQELESLAADGALVSGDDYYHAAYLLQHGVLPEEFRRAHHFAGEAMRRGSVPARWLFAATLDRWLVSIGERQQYGTQYVRLGPHGYALYTIDPQIADAERAQYDVPPLADTLRRLTRMNSGWPVPWVQRVNGKLQIVEDDDAPDAGPVHLLIPGDEGANNER